ncbi:hypothetical protein ACQEUU_34100 [Nonomuraea sp. CA-218870]|uniref:hypothetical protein n=1 Tax=Nonomuraea sp. CA-218870 TaxID=3239998 RepID=UPI003D8DA585
MDNDAYYTWREAGFSVSILLDGDADPEDLERGDAIVLLPRGDRYSALLLTREEVARVMDRGAESGESLSGSYFCTSDLVIVRLRGVTAMIDVIRDIVASGNISAYLPKIVDDGEIVVPTM